MNLLLLAPHQIANKSTLTVEYLSAPLPGDALLKIEATEALDFQKQPHIAMNGNQMIPWLKENQRKSKSVKIMIVYVATTIFHYDTTGNL